MVLKMVSSLTLAVLISGCGFNLASLNSQGASIDLPWIVKDAESNEQQQHQKLAENYYAALAKNDLEKRNQISQIVQSWTEENKKQWIGYLLLLNTGDDHREAILIEAEKQGLSRTPFLFSSSEVGDLKKALDAIVTSQEKAKVSLAVAIHNHYERLKKSLKKSNILVIGPSGTGKTLMVQTIAESLNVPFAIADASRITQAGYIGGKVEDAVAALAEKAGYDLEKIERGIIFFDEIDKVSARGGRAESDEFKRQAQANLLKIIEGIEIEVKIDKFRSMTVDTSKILFVCAGAFTGLTSIIKDRLTGENREIKENIYAQVSGSDLIAYGLTPEVVGRLPNVIALEDLKVSDLIHILKNPKGSILEEYRQIFNERDVELQFTDGALKAIAEKAFELKVGARGLRTVVEQLMSPLQYQMDSLGALRVCTVTEKMVREGGMPILEYR